MASGARIGVPVPVCPGSGRVPHFTMSVSAAKCPVCRRVMGLRFNGRLPSHNREVRDHPSVVRSKLEHGND